jgi:hypothetical protein
MELKPILAVNVICELRQDGVMKRMIHVMAQRFNPPPFLPNILEANTFQPRQSRFKRIRIKFTSGRAQ